MGTEHQPRSRCPTRTGSGVLSVLTAYSIPSDAAPPPEVMKVGTTKFAPAPRLTPIGAVLPGGEPLVADRHLGALGPVQG